MKMIPNVFLLLTVFVLVVCGPIRADIILYEPFDYGAGDIEDISGLGSNETGFTSAETWTNNEGDADYIAAGLNIGSGINALSTVGGRFNHTSLSQSGHVVSRGINFTQTGQIWGSYLWRPVSQPNVDVVNGVAIGQSYTIGDATGEFMSQSIRWRNNFMGGVTLFGQQTKTSGTPSTNGVTYLVLFTVTNLGGGGDQQIKQWILSEAQFEYFKTNDGELTEAELDSAATGTAEDNIRQSDSLTRAAGAKLESTYLLCLYSHNTNTEADYDEIRMSDTSLDEVVPVVGAPKGIVLIFY